MPDEGKGRLQVDDHEMEKKKTALRCADWHREGERLGSEHVSVVSSCTLTPLRKHVDLAGKQVVCLMTRPKVHFQSERKDSDV